MTGWIGENGWHGALDSAAARDKLPNATCHDLRSVRSTLRVQIVDASRFDALIRSMAIFGTRRHLFNVLPIVASVALVDKAQGKQRKFTYCLNGRTFRAKRRKLVRILAKGATRGRCFSCTRSCPSGCCTGTECRPGNAKSACGVGGSACVACPETHQCQGGTCFCTPDCLLKNCGADDGCGGRCQGPCPGIQYCYKGTCSTCPSGQERLSNGTCTTSCDTGIECVGITTDCRCFIGSGHCATALTERGCHGDSDCPYGEFCNPVNSKCAIAC